ncbi:MAG TPA: dipeptidase PepV [Methanoregulaceae archaeon]|nr:dipeptidase PepV [Methanoregulaceae archaeon]
MDDPELCLDGCVERRRDEIIATVSELVRIPSIAGDPGPSGPFGPGPARALIRVLEIARSYGLETTNLENYSGYAEFGTGSAYIVVLGHLDTVPEGDGWHHLPFGGEVTDGNIFGRGALDDKGPILAALFGLIALRDSGLAIERKVRILFGTDEETGSHDMEYYRSREPDPVAGFTPDAEFPVVFAEKGILWVEFSGHYRKVPPGNVEVLSIRGGTAVNMVPDFASAVVLTDYPLDVTDRCREYADKMGYRLSAQSEGNQVTITSLGSSAHGSTPGLGTNAIMRLLSYLQTLPLDPEGISPLIRFFNTAIGLDFSGSPMGINLTDEVSGDLTLNCGKIEAGGGMFSLTVDIRYPVTLSAEEVTTRIRKSLQETGIEMRLIKHDLPLHFSPESDLITTLLSVYRDITGDPTPPVAIGGGTYARRLPNVVAFGPYRPGQKPPIHGADEFISCDELIADAKIYARAIFRLARKS